MDNVTVRLCAVGAFCSLSTSTTNEPETLCHINFYNPVEGQTTCQPCPNGFTCDERGATSPVACPVGHYCPKYDATNSEILTEGDFSVVETTKRTNKIACPAGTYNPNEYSSSRASCSPCPPGKFCVKGSDAPTGICNEGYVCTGQQSVSEPGKYQADGVTLSTTTPF